MHAGRHLNKIQIIEAPNQPFITETTTGSFIVAGKGAQFTTAKEITPTETVDLNGEKHYGLTVAKGNAAAVGFIPKATVTIDPYNVVTSEGTDAFGKPKFAYADGNVTTFKPYTTTSESDKTHKEPAKVTVSPPAEVVG